MNRKSLLAVFAVVAALCIGYYAGSRSNRPDQVYSAASSIQHISNTSVPIATRTPKPQTEYVLNTNTKKFHKPSCSSVKQMKEKNKKIVTWTREEIINKGYDPCGRCHP